MVAAIQPMLGFIGGGVNNDRLLFAASAALLFVVARAMRRGLVVRLAASPGAALAVGLLTKATMVALFPVPAPDCCLRLERVPQRPAGALEGSR